MRSFYSTPRDSMPAGLLALLVHGIFFSLLYFGFSWQSHKPEIMVVDMWDTLPDVPHPIATPLEITPPPPAPPAIAKPTPAKPVADIDLADKKKKAALLEKENLEKKKLQAERDKKEALDKKHKAEQIERERKVTEALANEQKQEAERRIRQDARIRGEQERMRKEVDASALSEIDRYKEKIQSKIRRNIVMPPNVPASAEAKFFVRVLPGGDVVDVVLEKSSGNAAYDSAAERAIYKSRPLPLPANPELERIFRELRLSLKP